MTISLYDAVVPSIVRSLTALAAVLEKGRAHAEAIGVDPSVLVNARLAPDMLPLAGQVQRASDTAKGMIARLAGVENPSFPDTETTFAELAGRIEKTIAFAQSATRAHFEGADQRTIELKFRTFQATFSGSDYVFAFALPNLYFHTTTAYDILRHNGVKLAKLDYVGRL